MSLTRIDKELINGLIEFGVEEKAILGILGGLKTQEQRKAMIDFLVENREATQSDILYETVKIRRRKK